MKNDNDSEKIQLMIGTCFIWLIIVVGYFIVSYIEISVPAIILVGGFAYGTYQLMNSMKSKYPLNTHNNPQKRQSNIKCDFDSTVFFSNQVKSVVSVYNKSIIEEKRFVNILRDLYPNRDKIALLSVLELLINEGVCSQLLNCGRKDVLRFREKTVKWLNTINAGSEEYINQLIFGLAIGTKIISVEDFKKIENGSFVPKDTKLTITDASLTLWGCAGLALLPLILILHRADIIWHIIYAIGVFLSIAPLLIYIMRNDKLASFSGGVFLILCFIHILLFLFGIHIFGNKELLSFADFNTGLNTTGLKDHLNSNAYIMSYVAFSITPSIIIGTVIFSLLKDHHSFHIGIETVVGMILPILPFAFAIFMYHQIPKTELQRLREQIETFNRESEQLMKIHSKENKELAFLGFKLGDDIVAYKSESLKSVNRHHHIPQYIDSILYVEKEWDNLETSVYLFIKQNRILEIDVCTKQNPDSVKNLFITKYGKGEIFVERPTYNETFKYYPYDYDIDNPFFAYDLSVLKKSAPMSFTFENCKIEIHNFHKEDYYVYGDFSTLIVYSLNELATIISEDTRMREIQDSIANKRKNDSIVALQEEERRQLEQIEREKNENHRKAVNQI